VRIPILNGLGQSLRWLRDRQGKKQYQVAEAAGITKGMLSAYETGRQRPSLETLEKILDTLGCDLNDLHNAIQITNGRPEQMKRKGEGLGDGEPSQEDPGAGRGGDGSGTEIQRILGRRAPIPAEEERALSEMLYGFHRFLRYLHLTLEQALKRRQPTEPNTDEDL
jgi:transcriptional regulator with XRE-family HTH domain